MNRSSAVFFTISQEEKEGKRSLLCYSCVCKTDLSVEGWTAASHPCMNCSHFVKLLSNPLFLGILCGDPFLWLLQPCISPLAPFQLWITFVVFLGNLHTEMMATTDIHDVLFDVLLCSSRLFLLNSSPWRTITNKDCTQYIGVSAWSSCTWPKSTIWQYMLGWKSFG